MKTKNLEQLEEEGFRFDGEINSQSHVYKHEDGEQIFYNPKTDKVIIRYKIGEL